MMGDLIQHVRGSMRVCRSPWASHHWVTNSAQLAAAGRFRPLGQEALEGRGRRTALKRPEGWQAKQSLGHRAVLIWDRRWGPPFWGQSLAQRRESRLDPRYERPEG
jgi:hypothetical protein